MTSKSFYIDQLLSRPSHSSSTDTLPTSPPFPHLLGLLTTENSQRDTSLSRNGINEAHSNADALQQYQNYLDHSVRSSMPASSLMSALNDTNNNHDESGSFVSSENDHGRQFTVPDSTADRFNVEAQYKGQFQEQLRQLYKLGEELDRRSLLDELFQFLARRGTLINKVPIMATKVLDLYKLYKLVVAKNGIVEVIKRKLWMTIARELDLPPSITNAASFNLRSKYIKYLYEFEKKKNNFSTDSELQAAINGNKRDGRRAEGQLYSTLPFPLGLTNMYGVMPPMPTNPYEVLQQQYMNSILNAPAGLVPGGTMLSPFLPQLTTPLNTRNTNFPLNMNFPNQRPTFPNIANFSQIYQTGIQPPSIHLSDTNRVLAPKRLREQEPLQAEERHDDSTVTVKRRRRNSSKSENISSNPPSSAAETREDSSDEIIP